MANAQSVENDSRQWIVDEGLQSSQPGRRPLWITAGIYLTLVVLLQPFYRHHINPDGTSYLSLAAKWANGDWMDGITGHWAPLLIWLLALARKIGLEPFVAITAIDAVAALAMLAGLSRLTAMLKMDQARHYLVLSIASFWLVALTFDDVTPDLLLCCTLTWYLVLTIEANYLLRPKAAAVLGLVIGLAYLAKPYAVFFAFVHLGMTSLGRLGKEAWRIRLWLRQAIIICSIVVFFVGSWTALMSLKYRRFTTGSAATHCFLLISPRWGGVDLNNIGLIEPPNGTAASYWEDPEMDKLRIPSWSPFESRASFLYYLRFIGLNIGRILGWCMIFSIAMLPMFAVAIWKRRGKRWSPDLAVLVAAIVTYPLGYLFLQISGRYMWPVTMWLMIVACYLIPVPGRRIAGLILFGVSFLPYPVWCLSADSGQGILEYKIGTAIREGALEGRSASVDQWHRSLYASYYGGLQYCGTTTETSGPRVMEELRRVGVQYLIVWPGPNRDAGERYGLREIRNSGFGEAKIYAVD